MLNIQSTKTGERLDVMPDTTAPVNISVTDIRKAADRKGTWSKTIQLAPTKNNAVQLAYNFDVNLSKGTFDRSKKLPVLLLEGGTAMEGDFYLQLVNINKKRGKVVSYEAAVVNEVSDFFVITNTRYLTDLDYSDDNHFLTAANVVDKFDATAADSNYKYHLTANDDEVYDISQFKPAFFLRPMWDRIHQRAGKNYEWAGMNDEDVQFDKWVIPSNVDKAEGEQQPQVVATLAAWNASTTGTGVPPQLTFQAFNPDTEVLDVANLYNPTNGQFTSPIVVNAGANITYNLTFNVAYRVRNNTASAIKLYAPTGSGLALYTPRVYVRKNGTAITQNLVPGITGNNLTMGQTIAASGTFTMYTGPVQMSIGVSGFTIGDVLTLVQNVQQTYAGASWVNSATNVPASVSNIVDITDVKMTIQTNGGNGYTYGEWVEMNKFLPPKIKQSEVIAAVMTLNNMIVDTQRSTPETIVYMKRDAYYDAGEVKDWSKKLDQKQEHDISFLSDLAAKRQVLTYKEDKDPANESYKATTNEVYGQAEYKFKSEFAKEVETTEIVFSPTPLMKTNFGAIVPLYSGRTPNSNIRLLFDGGTKPCSPFRVVNFPGDEIVVATGYPYVGHFDDPITPTLDLNFGLSDFYMYPLESFTNNNMFNLNWRRTFNQIDNGRMLTGMFDLDEYDVKTLRLNDKIFCENEYWNINRVVDYDTNNRKHTKVELISVDDLLKIPTQTRKPVVSGAGVPITGSIRKVLGTVAEGLNTYTGLGPVMMLGKGNIVDEGVKCAIVLGDGKVISEEGIYTPKMVVEGNRSELCDGIVTDRIDSCTGDIFATGQWDFDFMPTVGFDSLTVFFQAASAMLSGLAAMDSTTGYVVQVGATTFVKRLITSTGAGIAVASGSGVGGNTTISIADDLAAIEALASNGIAVRTGTNAWAIRSMTQPAAGIAISNPAGTAGNFVFALSNDLLALENLSTTGFPSRTAADTWVQRTITGTAGQVTVTNGDGISGNPTVSLPAAVTNVLGIWARGTSGGGLSTGACMAGNLGDATGGGAVSMGAATFASGNQSLAKGSNTIASGLCSETGGLGAVASRTGEVARSSDTAGSGQYGAVTLYGNTTTSAATEIFIDGVSERFVVAAGETYHANVTCTGRRANGESKSWTLGCLIKNVGGTTTLVGSSATPEVFADAGMAAAALSVTADNINDSLRIIVTGIAGQIINWFVKLEYTLVK